MAKTIRLVVSIPVTFADDVDPEDLDILCAVATDLACVLGQLPRCRTGKDYGFDRADDVTAHTRKGFLADAAGGALEPEEV